MRRLALTLGVAALLGAAGCPDRRDRRPKPAPVRAPTRAETPSPSTAPAPAATTPGAAPPSPAEMAWLHGTKDLDQACRTLHGVLKRRMDLIKEHRGARPGDKTYPRVEVFVSRCKTLPPAAVRCMIPKLLEQHRAACISYLDRISEEDRAKVMAFRGTLL